jgi:hypothetical protein
MPAVQIELAEFLCASSHSAPAAEQEAELVAFVAPRVQAFLRYGCDSEQAIRLAMRSEIPAPWERETCAPQAPRPGLLH